MLLYGRLGHPRRPIRMSASVVTDVCVDRCGCLRRPLRMSAPTDADGKICGEGACEGCEGGAWEVCGRCVEGV
ncbi:hypothetical protein [Leyella stercorea]|uniref:hypothetical protein n=1 Tax=Leyella stercorea TaxID=363265 RepID=UPI00242C1EDC|nr:hypothetical protein [Leyella stercorea]